MLLLTDYGLDRSAEYSSVLMHDIRYECDMRHYEGLVCDFENGENEKLTRFIYDAGNYLSGFDIKLYVPLSYAEAAPKAHILIPSAVTGGSYQDYLSRMLYKYTPERAAIYFEPMCIDFIMPMPTGVNDHISRPELDALIRRLNAVSYYSRELGAYYFTYRDDEKRSRFVLFDDERSMIKKMATARQTGYREAFLLYSDARDSLSQLKEIAAL
jgi:hypothetical protein